MRRLFAASLTLFSVATFAQNAAVTVQINASTSKKSINPLIYGTAFASTTQLNDLNATGNRWGGNATSRYNWQVNASNRANDFFFESISEDSGATAGAEVDKFVNDAKAAGAQPFITVPLIDWVAKLGSNRAKLASFSIAKYGAQQKNDWQYFPDAGNGILTNGTHITNNDKNDANVMVDSAFQKAWIQHLVATFGTAANGGVRYYGLDNESSIWFDTHRDVHPTGDTMSQMSARMIDYATQIKAADPTALTTGPEEWGWDGFLYSGYDQQWAPTHNWATPDRDANGGVDYVAYLLAQMKTASQNSGTRLLDYFTLHYYPQGGEFSDDVADATQLLRNRSTRSLWDPNYVDESWIGTNVQLIPRMKSWVSANYPGTKIGLTEYNWGAEGHINGATAQADVMGILGREGVDVATRWTTPATNSPAYNAFKMYRNYDGAKSTFGDISVSCSVPNPDGLAAFAAVRSFDRALTVMVISKVLSGSTPVTLNLGAFAGVSPVQAWQLTSTNTITRLSDLTVGSNAVSTSVPAQSITLFVIPAATNGKPNILWRNRSTGANAFWIMNRTSVTGVVDLPSLPNSNYYIEASGDMNGDGARDVIWRNQTTGQNAIWLLNASAQVQQVIDLPGLPNSSYWIEATGDFNNDGKRDIVWRNQSTGQTAVWLMNGTAYAGTVDLPTIPNSSYRACGTGDFNNDGNVDLVWRNYTTGQNAVWLMNGTTVVSTYDFPTIPNTAYVLSAIDDFSGDGNPDIAWRNQSTGQNAIWVMNGTAVSSTVDLPGLPNSSYEVVGPR